MLTITRIAARAQRCRLTMRPFRALASCSELYYLMVLRGKCKEKTSPYTLNQTEAQHIFVVPFRCFSNLTSAAARANQLRMKRGGGKKGSTALTGTIYKSRPVNIFLSGKRILNLPNHPDPASIQNHLLSSCSIAPSNPTMTEFHCSGTRALPALGRLQFFTRSRWFMWRKPHGYNVDYVIFQPFPTNGTVRFLSENHHHGTTGGSERKQKKHSHTERANQ